jgi:hypothetical protein
VTWILAVATFAVLTTIAIACRRAALEAQAALRDWAPPALTLIEGGRSAEAPPAGPVGLSSIGA